VGKGAAARFYFFFGYKSNIYCIAHAIWKEELYISHFSDTQKMLQFIKSVTAPTEHLPNKTDELRS
jgi:hypothetical protein